MKCPFDHAALSPSITKATAEPSCPVTGTKAASGGDLGRRSMLGLLTAGLGSMFVGLPGCMTVGAEEEGSQAGAQSATSFLAQYDAIGGGGANITPQQIGAKGQLVSDWVNRRPLALFKELRDARRPVLQTASFKTPVPTLVAFHADVVDIIDSNTDFTVEPYRAEAELALDWFTLADANTARHDEEKALFMRAVTPESAEAHRSIVRRHAEALVAAGKSGGQIDVVRALGQPLPVKIIHEYFGIPSGEASGPTTEEMHEWIGAMFRNFFLNLGGRDQAVVDAGREAGEKLLAHVQATVAARKRQLAAQPVPTDILGKFLVLQRDPQNAQILSDDRIAKNMIGIIAGAGAGTVAKAIANIMDVLTDPKWGTGSQSPWQRTVRAARTDNTTELWKLAREALRFNPQGVAIARLCTTPTTIGGVTIPKDQVVLASTLSAMHDPAVFKNPDEFSTDADHRKAEDYLHMGARRYECLGKHLAPVEISEAVRALARLPNLRRGAGKLEYVAVYPSSFVLEHG